MTRTLYHSHRHFGFELGRITRPDDGIELVILETAPNVEAVAPAATLRAAKQEEIEFEARMALLAAIERARFLGLDSETIQSLVTQELGIDNRSSVEADTMKLRAATEPFR